jgi:uridine kinase
MEDAVDAIRKFAAGRCSARTVVGITGPVGAGKSHLAAALARCVISTDSYLPDYEHIPEAQRDLPELAHYHALGEDLRHLKQGTAREIPVWSFQTHRRESVQLISPESLIVCEGIQAFYPPVRASLDVCVFVEAPADVRWSRWEHLEITGVRGWGVEVAHRFFHTVADPTFERFAPEYRALADVVVTNDRYKPRRQ